MEWLAAHWRFVVFVFFCLIVTIQLGYIIYYFSRLAFFKPVQKQASITYPVSVVVCARDEAANLAKNLPGVLMQEYRTTHEVIVVDDNSYDDTKYLLEALHKQYRQLHVVSLTQEAKMIQGKKFPLSVGIKTAKHEIVLLTDADCVPATEHWINSMQKAYNEGVEIVLGYGAYAKRPGMLNKLVRWETFHTAIQYLSYALAGNAYMGVGRNLSYRKTIFFRHKGFASHNNIPGGDDDLFINAASTKNNVAINVDPESFTISDAPTTWAAWQKQKTRHYSTGKYYKSRHKMSLASYAVTQFLFYPMAIAAILLYDWKIAGAVFLAKMIVQGLLYFKLMKKLGEQDLFSIFILLEWWTMIYYLKFLPALWKKPGQHWK